MTKPDLSRLHEWLLISNGDTAAEMWHDLTVLRARKNDWPGLPATLEALEAGLAQLEAAGLARSEGSGRVRQFWWLQVPVKAKPQRELFA